MQLEQKISKSFDSLFNLIPGGIFGIVSMIIGLTGDLLAALFYPGGYSIFEHMISHLGTLWLNPGRVFFNLGVILCGLVGIPFDIYLGRVFKNEYGESNWIKVAVISNIASSIALIVVGISLSLSLVVEDLPFFIHGICAVICFLGAAIYCIIYSSIILKQDQKFPKYFAIFGFSVAGVEVIFIFTWQPFIEWLANFSIITWIIIMSLFILYKNY